MRSEYVITQFYELKTVINDSSSFSSIVERRKKMEKNLFVRFCALCVLQSYCDYNKNTVIPHVILQITSIIPGNEFVRISGWVL